MCGGSRTSRGTRARLRGSGTEVRNLAQRPSGAAKEIKELISTSVLKGRERATVANEAGTTMSEVTQAVARVTDIMDEIAAASTEQSKANSLEDQGRQLTRCIAVFRLEPTTIK
jgi:methyl-accepting chemotaxis protein